MKLQTFLLHLCAEYALVRITIDGITISGLPGKLHGIIPGEYMDRVVCDVSAEESVVVVHLLGEEKSD